MNEARKAMTDYAATIEAEKVIVQNLNDLHQQVKDGLITQAEADAIARRLQAK